MALLPIAFMERMMHGTWCFDKINQRHPSGAA
jgi:hypothetical protein